jgi:hypothetical protein
MDRPRKPWKPIKRRRVRRPKFDFWYDHDPSKAVERQSEYEEARARRDSGMDKVLAAEHEAWKLKALLIALTVPDGWVGLFEEVRIYITSKGHTQPHKPQVWSALCGAWIKQEYFERVDDWGQPISKESNASTYRKIRRTAKPYTEKVRGTRRSSPAVPVQTSSREPESS